MKVRRVAAATTLSSFGQFHSTFAFCSNCHLALSPRSRIAGNPAAHRHKSTTTGVEQFPRQKRNWTDLASRKTFFDWISEKLEVQRSQDWYEVNPTDISNRGGSALLRDCKSCLVVALEVVYPQFEWNHWCFTYFPVPSGFWNSLDNRRKYFDWLEEKLQLSNKEDWYNVRLSDVIQNFGGGLLGLHYGNSLVKALSHVYPSEKWLSWKFGAVTSGFWTIQRNRRECMDWIGRQLRVERTEDWYNVSCSDVIHCGGAGLLAAYGGSLFHALEATYTEQEWHGWKFTGHPVGFWDSAPNQKKFVEWFAKEKEISTPEDWNRVRYSEFRQLGGNRLLNHFGSLNKLLRTLYPHLHKDSRRLYGPTAPNVLNSPSNSTSTSV